MKRTRLVFASLLGTVLLLSGCNGSDSGESDKDYFIVTYMYNNPSNSGTYKNVVVYNNQTIEEPEDPIVKDYIFAGWYSDEACEHEYLRWGLSIESDLTLYAKWTDYASAKLDVQVSKLHGILEKMSLNVYKTVQDCTATVGYPGISSDYVFGVDDKYVYNRYSDITVKDYYANQDDGSEDYYGQEQYSYDSAYFYDIYRDMDGTTENSSSQSVFSESKLESFLNIGYYNLFKSCGTEMVYYWNNLSKDGFEYEFTGNFTELGTIRNGNYSYVEGYSASQYSDTAGTYITNIYEYSYGLEIVNGKIKAASVDTYYRYIIGDEEYYYVYDTSTYDFYYGNGTYSEYTGTRF